MGVNNLVYLQLMTSLVMDFFYIGASITSFNEYMTVLLSFIILFNKKNTFSGQNKMHNKTKV